MAKRPFPLVTMGEALLDHNGLPYRLVMGRHPKFFITINGKKVVVGTARTTSDKNRAAKNLYHQIKRAAAEVGVTLKSDSKQFIGKGR